MREEENMTDFYNKTDELIENDEMTTAEAGFMRGYNEAVEVIAEEEE